MITQTMSEKSPAAVSPSGRKRKMKAPMYQVLKADLEKEIQLGNLKPGQLVPSESELIARYRVSSTTARRCLDELENAGLLERKRGKGTFVSPLAGVLNRRRMAVVVKDLFSLTHPFLATVVGTIERELRNAGIHVVIVRAHVDEHVPDANSHLLELVVHEGADQVFLLSNMPLAMVLPLVEHGIKCLGVNTRYLDPRIPHISQDFRATLCLNLTELLQRGHRRIVLLTSEAPMKEAGVLNSSSLFEEFFAELHTVYPELPAKPDMVVADSEKLGDQILEIMRRPSPPTAFHCWDELAAMEVMRLLTEAGYAVPGDVSVVGSKLLPTSPVACVEMPLTEIATVAAQAMLDWLDGEVPASRLIPPVRFLPRQTIAEAP